LPSSANVDRLSFMPLPAMRQKVIDEVLALGPKQEAPCQNVDVPALEALRVAIVAPRCFTRRKGYLAWSSCWLTAEQRTRLRNEAVVWLRNNRPNPKHVDEPTLEKLANIGGRRHFQESSRQKERRDLFTLCSRHFKIWRNQLWQLPPTWRVFP